MEIDELLDEKIAKFQNIENHSGYDSTQSSFDQGESAGSSRVAFEAINDLKELKQSLPLKQEKVEVPESFDTDYKAHSHLFHNKSEMLSTAMGGIYRTIFPSQFDGKNRNIYRTGIDWNNWSSETILWASRNYEDFCLAVISGNYTVKKEPEWLVAIPGQEAFSGLIEFDKKRKGVSSTCDNQTSVKFTDKAKAEAVALLIGGEVVPVEDEAE